MLESVIEKELKTQVRLLGGECFKFVSPGLRGVTDQIVLIPTLKPVEVFYRLYWVECKQAKKKPGKHQVAFHERLKKMNQDVRILDSVDEIARIVR